MSGFIRCSSCSKQVDLSGKITFGLIEGKFTLTCPYCNSRILARPTAELKPEGVYEQKKKNWKLFRNGAGDVQAVKEGWSWPAFCF